MKALLLLTFVAGISYAGDVAVSVSVKRLMTDDEYLAAFIEESENLQTAPISDEARSRLYFLDKKLAKICPKKDQDLTCSRFMKANPKRFVSSEMGYYLSDYWLVTQRVSDPKAHGDYELEQILRVLDEVSAGGLSPIKALESIQVQIRTWLANYPYHVRLSDAIAAESRLGRRIQGIEPAKDPD